MSPQPISAAARILGERARKRRNELGLSQEELGKLTGVHWTFISQVERGLRNLNLHNLLKIANGLRVDPGDLIAGLAPPPDPASEKKRSPRRASPRPAAAKR
uniref:helix-turn-helix domain-containing protein n=1 Tax=Amycolatopsis sp. CA-096443 TaxID=3239919 RepID=UPI003F4976E2